MRSVVSGPRAEFVGQHAKLKKKPPAKRKKVPPVTLEKIPSYRRQYRAEATDLWRSS